VFVAAKRAGIKLGLARKVPASIMKQISKREDEKTSSTKSSLSFPAEITFLFPKNPQLLKCRSHVHSLVVPGIILPKLFSPRICVPSLIRLGRRRRRSSKLVVSIRNKIFFPYQELRIYFCQRIQRIFRPFPYKYNLGLLKYFIFEQVLF
jgi:hypothetical protein